MCRVKAFGDTLRAKRRGKGLTQEALAERAGVSVRGIQEIERGVVRAPRHETLEMLADALGLEAEERRQWQEARRRLSLRTEPRKDEDRPDLAVTTPSSQLIGRDDEIADIVELILRDDVRLVTITGTGGVGKTRVALEVSRQLEDRFPDGVIVVELANIREPGLVIPTIARSIGFNDLDPGIVHERIGAFFRCKRCLLVLDNFEHLLREATSVSKLLAADSTSRILVTSRSRLKLRDEHEYPLDPFLVSTSPSSLDPDDVGKLPAVQLFVHRARQLQPTFILTEDNAEDVLEICRHLDGLPLAIELAAARLKLFSPSAMLPRLADQMTFLASGFQDGPDRHQTMRKAIAWSYALLSTDVQDFFRRLSTFAGGWTVEAAASLHTSPASAIEHLETLLDNSLIYRHESTSDGDRFGMLEVVREFARERIEESGDACTAYRDHAMYFLRLVEDAEPNLRGPDQDRWMDAISGELPNIRAALGWFLQHSDDPEPAIQLAGSASWFWFTRGYVSEGRQWLTRGLERGTSPTKARMKAAAAAGWLAHFQHDATAARAYLGESLQIARSVGDDWFIAWVLHLQGRVAYFDGDVKLARELGHQSLECALKTGDEWLVAWAYHLMALAAQINNEFSSAREYHHESIRIRQRIGDQPGIATNLSLLGMIDFHEGEYAAAMERFRESLIISEQIEATWFLANVISNMAAVAARLDEPERSTRLFAFAEELYSTVGAGPIPIGEEIYQGAKLKIRRELEPDRIDSDRTEGATMTLSEAIEEAMMISLAAPSSSGGSERA